MPVPLAYASNSQADNVGLLLVDDDGAPAGRRLRHVVVAEGAVSLLTSQPEGMRYRQPASSAQLFFPARQVDFPEDCSAA
jgi:hypothetical protein